VQNLAPGAAARLGLSYATLSAEKPGIIVCDISGYGEDGPYRDKKAYDLLIQSESGFVSVTGTPDEPAKAGLSIADIAAGMYAYTNILAALLHRQKTGRGQHIDISMLESLVEWMSFPLLLRVRRRRAALRAPGRATRRSIRTVRSPRATARS
jgi:crotonobetainyl-CoA:carnitine CoA-transferase CaiB-like acyl-CoA transferase